MKNNRGARVCVYARVSTSRQATNDLSIPDQIAHAKRWCDQNGAAIVETLVDAGASATDDTRPNFQKMISAATGPDRPYDVILVHSLSRLFRNALHFLQYRSKLRRAKVSLISITQDFGDDPAADLSTSLLALFDEYQSQETAKHTQRAMVENARQGFWNGQTPPLGYRTYEAERRGSKSKKKLEIDEDEAFIVRKIFDLYLRGPAGAGPLGVTRVSSWLNDNGYKNRGKRFHVSRVQAILRNTAYAGTALYNRQASKTGEVRPEQDWIPIPVPPLIDQGDFDEAQSKLLDNRPQRIAARVTTTNNLLIGIAKCGCTDDGCGGGMTISTGKSGRYKYYACSARARAGASVCAGRRIRMEELDALVLERLEKCLFIQERLVELLSGWLDHSAAAVQRRREQLRALRTRRSSLEGGLDRLLDLVIEGQFTASDPSFARKKAELTGQIAQMSEDIQLLEGQLAKSERQITPKTLLAFSELVKLRLRAEDASLRRFYVRALVSRVEVGESEIRIVGSNKDLERAVGATFEREVTVPIIERRWRARRDSNPRPPD